MLRLVAVNRFHRGSRKQLNVPIRWLVALGLPQQLRQPCDVDRDAPRLVEGEHLRLPRFGFVVSRGGMGRRWRRLCSGRAGREATGEPDLLSGTFFRTLISKVSPWS
jgi:hypothetical protein